LPGPTKSQKGGSISLTRTQCLSPSLLSEVTSEGWGCLGALVDDPSLIWVCFNRHSLTIPHACQLTTSLSGGGVIHKEDRGSRVISPSSSPSLEDSDPVEVSTPRPSIARWAALLVCSLSLSLSLSPHHPTRGELASHLTASMSRRASHGSLQAPPRPYASVMKS
jgi:hypothetical protein